MKILAALAVLLITACQGGPGQPQNSDLSGTVSSASGPEAGVWVIAETTDLPTKFTKIVVTDDRGRYLIPELPKANYSVWVRGYGLVDSPKVPAVPGQVLDLKAVTAPSAAAAAEYYPPIYWYSMLKIPPKSEFPVGKVASQPEWLNTVKTNGCMSCHALGTKGTRTIPKDFAHMKSTEAWAWPCGPTGPTASPPASCPSCSPSVRAASSAMSCSRCGTGAVPRLICMT
jgi:hypothetical protein